LVRNHPLDYFSRHAQQRATRKLMTEDDRKAILHGYELRIQLMMLDLDEELQVFGARIDHVDIDTRKFANMKTEIHTKQRQHKRK
jgi:hypothetical protein